MSGDRTFERIASLFDIELFADIKVLVLGCGSGGGNVALQLVMSGIRNFTLIDHDVMGPENVIRHVCGRRFIGRRKVEAVAEGLHDRNPEARISTIEADIMQHPSMASMIGGSDVVVLATDNEPSRYAVNELCVKQQVPFVVGRVFTRGIGGEVFRNFVFERCDLRPKNELLTVKDTCYRGYYILSDYRKLCFQIKKWESTLRRQLGDSHEDRIHLHRSIEFISTARPTLNLLSPRINVELIVRPNGFYFFVA